MHSTTLKSRNRVFFDRKVTKALNNLTNSRYSIVAMNMAVGAGGIYMNIIYR